MHKVTRAQYDVAARRSAVVDSVREWEPSIFFRGAE